MVQIPKPVFRLRLGFSGETLLCLANIIHTSTECSFGIVPSGFAHASSSPILAALRLTCTVPQVLCDGLSPSPTTMAAPTPFHHFNHSLSSPYAGRVVGSPTFATKPFAPKFRFLLYARPMSPDIVVIVRWLIPHEPLSVRLHSWTFSLFSMRHNSYPMTSIPSPSFPGC